MGSLIIIVGLILFIVAYFTYGKYLSKVWGVDPSRPTPAYTINDGIDYVPAPKIVLFGHHFSSIAGAAPVVGAITAAMFGWVPVFLWCVIGSIFVGGVQDFGALFASVRHGAASIATVVQKYTGLSGKRVFCVFAFFSADLLAAAFVDIVASTFVSTPACATASIWFIVLAIIYGFATNKLGVPTLPASIVGVILLFLGVWVGVMFPAVLPKTTWMLVLVVYIAIAAVCPVWALLQPRDYLNSYLLEVMMVACVIGIIVYRPGLNAPAFTGFMVNGSPLFPTLFVTFACGACSGVHSLVGSGTTSKQVANESHMQVIAYFGMLLEGFLALVALTCFVFLTPDVRADVVGKGAMYVFTYGLGCFLSSLGIPFALAQTFGGLALSAFAMTTMDTALRLTRYVTQEFFAGDRTVQEAKADGNIMCNNVVCMLIALALCAFIAFMGYLKIWTLFGTSNQMLSALALMGIVLWLRSIGKKYAMCLIPMWWMIIVGTCSCIYVIYSNWGTNWAVTIIAILLLIAAVFLYKQVFSALRNKQEAQEVAMEK